MIGKVYRYLNELMHRPMQIFWICLSVAFAGILLDGTAFRLWSLRRDHQMLSERIHQSKGRSKQLESRLRQAQQPEFIEKAARDQFDMVKDGDLVFIFSDDAQVPPEKASEEPHNTEN